MEHFRKLENMYHAAPINQFFQPKMKVFEGKVEIIMEVESRFFHAGQALHGSVFFKMLDDATYFAASSSVQDVFLLTSSFNLHFLRPIDKGPILSIGELRFSSSHLLIADARLFNEEGKEVAYGTGTLVKSKHPLSAEMGYL